MKSGFFPSPEVKRISYLQIQWRPQLGRFAPLKRKAFSWLLFQLGKILSIPLQDKNTQTLTLLFPFGRILLYTILLFLFSGNNRVYCVSLSCGVGVHVCLLPPFFHERAKLPRTIFLLLLSFFGRLMILFLANGHRRPRKNESPILWGRSPISSSFFGRQRCPFSASFHTEEKKEAKATWPRNPLSSFLPLPLFP